MNPEIPWSTGPVQFDYCILFEQAPCLFKINAKIVHTSKICCTTIQASSCCDLCPVSLDFVLEPAIWAEQVSEPELQYTIFPHLTLMHFLVNVQRLVAPAILTNEHQVRQWCEASNREVFRI